MRRLSARHSTSARPGRTALTREVFWFVVIGVASTVAQALLYWVLRHWSPPILANFASLLVVTVLNTEANRRLTFRGSTVRVHQAHLAAGGLFVLAYLVTSGALLLFRHYQPTASPAAETLVLAPSFALATVVRFTVLRMVVFRRRHR
ncbi:GtrA family protein [Streptomyces sp. NBC_01788]|uniref:GtrA family protein n=1 Tax=Streptomyces sp. NBC_01788 TaxID=2975940 RepID=UPI002DD96658|nr:GtrA family protein [Streptomyces sp. NBC_01788]WSB29388.1 GtrA family protein [Streptomyces sp. NBC_01788]